MEYKNKDGILKCLVHSDQFRLSLVNLTDVLRDAVKRHDCDPLAAIALGRAFASTALLGTTLKEEQQYVRTEFVGDGPGRTVSAEFIFPGSLRGYVGVPQVASVCADSKKPIPQSVSEYIGKGHLKVRMGRPGQSTPYESVVGLASGEIAEDVAQFLLESEQILSIVSVGVQLDPKTGEILSCGGALLQKMGDAEVSEELYASYEELFGRVSISKELASGKSNHNVLQTLADSPLDIQNISTQRPVFNCLCTVERMKEVLASVPSSEIENIRKEQGSVDIVCHFCNTTYSF